MSEKKQKDFDAVRLMRRLREKLSRETEGMSYEEEKHYIQERVKRRTSREERSSSEDAA